MSLPRSAERSRSRRTSSRPHQPQQRRSRVARQRPLRPNLSSTTTPLDPHSTNWLPPPSGAGNASEGAHSPATVAQRDLYHARDRLPRGEDKDLMSGANGLDEEQPLR